MLELAFVKLRHLKYLNRRQYDGLSRNDPNAAFADKRNVSICDGEYIDLCMTLLAEPNAQYSLKGKYDAQFAIISSGNLSKHLGVF